MEKLLINATSEISEAVPNRQSKDFYLCLSTAIDDLANQIAPASPNFGLLLLMDAKSIDDAQLGELAGKLIDKGLAYLCAWGPDCERVHDSFDEAANLRDPEPGDNNVIITTSHSDESLEESLWFFVNCAFPAPSYELTCKEWIIALVGSQEWEQIIRREFKLLEANRTS